MLFVRAREDAALSKELAAVAANGYSRIVSALSSHGRQTERNHQFRVVVARLAMMHSN